MQNTGTTSSAACAIDGAERRTLLQKLNSAWHKPALQLYMFIVLAHWAEHLAQATQIYLLNMPVPESRGFLGYFYPWLVKSELLHYGYALIMLAGLWFLRTGFVGRSRTWWMIAFWIQFWHHIEHALLQGQAIFHHNLFGSPVPMSIAQIWIPRVELHLFYNTVVFVPMIIAMYYHMFPPVGEEVHANCACSYRKRPARAVAA